MTCSSSKAIIRSACTVTRRWDCICTPPQKKFCKTPCNGDAPEKVNLHCGEILRIRRTGGLEADKFDDSKLFDFSPYCWPYRRGTVRQSGAEELRMVAGAFGYAPEEIDELLSEGFTVEELEDYLYCGEI